MSTDYNPYDALEQQRLSKEIRVGNDAFRRQYLAKSPGPTRDQLFISRRVTERGNDFVDRAVKAVRDFSDFDDNDPRGEHSLGSFDLDGVALGWQIIYDAEDVGPWGDLAASRRILMIFLADE
jgi:hypothetical protein